jgi:hypothetical protein
MLKDHRSITANHRQIVQPSKNGVGKAVVHSICPKLERNPVGLGTAASPRSCGSLRGSPLPRPRTQLELEREAWFWEQLTEIDTSLVAHAFLEGSREIPRNRGSACFF